MDKGHLLHRNGDSVSIYMFDLRPDLTWFLIVCQHPFSGIDAMFPVCWTINQWWSEVCSLRDLSVWHLIGYCLKLISRGSIFSKMHCSITGGLWYISSLMSTVMWNRIPPYQHSAQTNSKSTVHSPGGSRALLQLWARFFGWINYSWGWMYY